MKTKLLLGAACAAAAIASVPASRAQPLPAPVIAVVNVDQIIGTCTVCGPANTLLQQQGQQLQNRLQQLQAQIRTEGAALEPLVRAIPPGGQPDAALTTRLQAFQTLQTNADREIGQGRERIQRNIQFVRQQIFQRIEPAINQIMTQRGATLVFDRGAVIGVNPTLDVTASVLAIVNQNGAALNVNAPPPSPAAGAAPATPAPAQPTRPRPQGR